MDNEQAIRGVAIFSGLGTQAVKQLASIAEREEHALGAPVFKEGDKGDRMYVIIDGEVRISRNLAGVGEEALAILKPGDYFGEMAILDDAPRSADALAHHKCQLLALRKESIEDLLFLNKDLAYEILWSFVRTLASRLRETNDKMTFLALSGRF